jgi:hypothetical protein
VRWGEQAKLAALMTAKVPCPASLDGCGRDRLRLLLCFFFCLAREPVPGKRDRKTLIGGFEYEKINQEEIQDLRLILDIYLMQYYSDILRRNKFLITHQI